MKRSRGNLQKILCSLFCLASAACSQLARADSLTIAYAVDRHQMAAVQTNAFSGFYGLDYQQYWQHDYVSVDGRPEPFEPYVASFQNGTGFPGIILGSGQRAGTINLAVVSLQFFDPSPSLSG